MADDARIAALEQQLDEARQTINALISGEVDSVTRDDVGPPVLLQAAQEQLRANEQLLRAVFDNSLDAKLIVDDHGVVIDANTETLALFQMTKSQLLGKNVRDVASSGASEGAWNDVLRATDRGELVLERPGAPRRELIFRSQPHVLPHRHLLMLRDVTARNADERALRESERRLSVVISNAPLILFAFDRDGIYTLYEGKGVELVGLRQGELVGQSLFHRQRYGADPGEVVQQVFAGEHVRLEFEQAGFVFEGSLSPVRDSQGVVVSAIGVAVNITERTHAEESLRKSEARLRAMFEYGDEGVLLVNRDGIITYASPPAARIIGRYPAPVVGTPAMEVVLDVDRKELAAKTRSLAKAPGASHLYEFQIQTPAGPVRWLEMMATNLLEEPAVRAFVANFRDITERKRAEVAVEENRQQLEDAQAIARLGSWTAFADPTAPVLWSPECAQIFELDHASPPTTNTFWELLNPQDRPRVVEQLERGSPFEGEVRIQLPSGGYRWVFSRTVARGQVAWVDGMPRGGADDGVRIVGVLQDITARRRGEDARRMLAAIVESSSDAIISCDKTGRIQTWNRGAEQLLLYSSEEAVGQPLTMLYPRDRKADVEHGAPERDRGESALLRKDGVAVEVAISSSVLVDELGETVGASISVRDVSDRRRAEAALRRTEEQLLQSQKMEAVADSPAASRMTSTIC